MLWKSLLTGCLLLSAMFLKAQVPGYLGMRWYAKMNTNLSIPIHNPTANNRVFLNNNFYNPGGSSAFVLNTRFGGQLGYTFSRSRSVFGELNLLETGMILNLSTPSIGVGSQDDFHYLFYNLSATSVRAGLKLFKLHKGALGPLGVYNAVSFETAFVRGEIIEKSTTYGFGASPEEDHRDLGVDPKLTLLYIGYEFGYHSIFFDRILVDVGGHLRAPLNIGKLLRAITEESITPYSVDYQAYNQEQFEQEATVRLAMHSWITFKVGVGLLLF